MAHFITFASYSQSGLKGLLDKPEDRAEALNSMIERVGGKLVALYNTTGRQDVVLVSQAPDTADAVALSMAVSSSGTVSRVETVRAWTGAEFIEVARKAAELTSSYTPPGR